MPDYISRFKGNEIDEAIQKARDITKTAGEINTTLEDAENIKNDINMLADNELIAKDSNGQLKGSGIKDEGDKLFFEKDVRLPSGSLDVGPSITLSEASGWLRIKDHSTNDVFFAIDSKNTLQGSQRPIYYEHGSQQTIIIQNDDSQILNSITSINYTPTEFCQVNALYLNFATNVNNLRIEVVSTITNKPIKYIPNEKTWKNQIGGLNLAAGLNNVFIGDTFSPMLFEPSTPLKINLIADNAINLKSNGSVPYIKIDRQLITAKGILLQGEGTGSPDTPEQIRDKLTTLTGENRLDASSIKNIQGGGGSDTAESIRDKLQTLTGANRLNATAIQGIEGIYTNLDGGTATSSFTNTIEGGNASGY